MGRHKKFTAHEALQRFLRLTRTLGRRPTGREVARDLRVSPRTAWRYLNLVTGQRECPRCHGNGWIPARAGDPAGRSTRTEMKNDEDDQPRVDRQS